MLVRSSDASRVTGAEVADEATFLERVNGQRYGYYKADAVIVATPNGSTAYNYAAGGPILSPSAGVCVVTPVAPMAGIGRAVVLAAGDVVELTVAEDSAPVAVDVDGTPAAELGPGDVLTTRMREDAGRVVRLAAGLHQARSQVKLSLLDLPLRRDQLLELVPESVRNRGAAAGDQGFKSLGSTHTAHDPKVQIFARRPSTGSADTGCRRREVTELCGGLEHSYSARCGRTG
ncbi:hypothetical protein [Symbioplanes lichenis]|uniref:hypothetical protein n=1 Tax=Symbioplanes lichenis TaxID=1629072 RepID=UPI0027383DAE|nr:hypothetical protein [Actinoplanes lichenis]